MEKPGVDKAKPDFEALLDESPDAVIATTVSGEILYWNKGAECLFGYSQGEAVGATVEALIVPPDLAMEAARIRRETIELRSPVHEAVRRRKDGSLVYVDVSSKAVREAGGRLRFLLSTEKDVTVLKVQRNAKLLEARFGGLLESTPDGMVMVDPTGRVVLMNGHAGQLFGYARGEMLGQSVECLIPQRFRSAHGRHRGGYFEHPRTRAMGAGLELYGLRKDGTEFPVEISLSPLETEEGMLVLSAIRDISDRVEFHLALREKNAALEAANEELESFSYSISHDLRAPVRAMASYARILNQEYMESLPKDAQQALRRVQENAVQMGHLIDGLLVLSNLGRQALDKSQVQPAALARAAYDDLQSEIDGREVHLQISDLPPCKADATLLRQVFANLLSNALKYTRARQKADVTVGWKSDNGRPVYYVKDNGAGFEMAYSSKLFRAFQRLHSAEQFEGTGVGLAIVQRIIQRHGGRIWAEAAVEQGATFFFTLGDDAHE